jgi:hypothetical protein
MRPVVVGAVGPRPEVIQMAPLVLRLRWAGSGLDVPVLTTGQHRTLLDRALAVFNLWKWVCQTEWLCQWDAIQIPSTIRPMRHARLPPCPDRRADQGSLNAWSVVSVHESNTRR